VARLAPDHQTHPGGATGSGATDLVVLLELLTGRQPVEVLPAQRQRWDLVGWVTQMRSLGRHDEVLDGWTTD